MSIPSANSSWQQSRYIVAAGLLILGLLCWADPTAFLWRDDWKYLLWYYQGDLHLFKGLVGTDIKPLFQYLFFAEFRLFGPHFFWYQLINVLLLVSAAWLIYLLSRQLGLSPFVAAIAATVYLIHPTHFVNAFWIAQQCELAHILLLLAALYFGMTYLADGKPMQLLWSSTFMLTQNYFFPNGTFFPLLLIALAYGSPHKKRRTLIWGVSAILLLTHFFFAWYIQRQFPANVQQSGAFADVAEKLLYVLKLSAVSVWRLLIPNYNPMVMPLWLTLASLPVFSIAYFFTLDRLTERWVWFQWTLGGVVLAAVTLAMTRYGQPEILYYYTSLQLVFLVPALAAMAAQLAPGRPRLVRIAAVLITAVFMLANLKGRMIFAERNEKNRLQMEVARRTGTGFDPYDDPALAWENFLILDGQKSNRTAPFLYEFLIHEDE